MQSARTTFINFNGGLRPATPSPRRPQLKSKNNHQRAVLFKHHQQSTQKEQSTTFDFRKWLELARSQRKQAAETRSVENKRESSVLAGNHDILIRLYGSLRCNEKSVHSPTFSSSKAIRMHSQPTESLRVSLKEVNRISNNSDKKMLAYCTKQFKTQMQARPTPQNSQRKVKSKAAARNFIRKNLIEESRNTNKKRPLFTRGEVKRILAPAEPVPIMTSRSQFRKSRREWGSVEQLHSYSRLAEV